MDQRPEKRDGDRYIRHPNMQEGDIVVTRVARHYALGRVTADHETQTPLETENHRADALRRACILAGAQHRTFLYDLAGPSSACLEIICAKIK
jgi:hypothetical protein